MIQINPFFDFTLYFGIVVHIGQNSHFLQITNEHNPVDSAFEGCEISFKIL
jgi:hypothetical protein